MKLRSNVKIVSLAMALLASLLTSPAFAQRGVVTDWSSHHVIFNNPGSEMDALMNGRRQEWQSYTNNPRYRSQQMKRSAAWFSRFANTGGTPGFGHPTLGFVEHATSFKQSDWSFQIAPAGSGTARGMYPAEYSNDFSVASCADFVVFPVDAAGKSGTGTGQANLVGFDHLYSGTCTSGTVPTLKFSYFVGEGKVLTSPTMSEDGKKVVFVESVTGGTGSNLHVLTLGTHGNNGSAYNSPAVPHTIIDNGNTVFSAGTNDATDDYVTMNGGVGVTRSSPWVDYADGNAANAVAYAGDDQGNLHKFTGIFSGTLREVTTGGWPAIVTSGAILSLPVLDPATGKIFVGASDGRLYCILSSTAGHCTPGSVDVSNGSSSSGAVIEGPIVVDNGATSGTTGWVFDEAMATNGSSTSSVLMQADTNLGSVTRLNLGTGGMNLYKGDFNNMYYNSSASSGYAGANMYFCGNATYRRGIHGSSVEPTLYQIAFNSTTGAMTTATQGPELVQFGSASTSNECSPLTEVFNGTQDLLFVGVRGEGNTGSCGINGKGGKTFEACIMNFDLGSSFGDLSPITGLPLGGNGNGSSGIIIDNTSTQPGASQIYFSNLERGNAEQAPQSMSSSE